MLVATMLEKLGKTVTDSRSVATLCLSAVILLIVSYLSCRYECLPGCLETHGKVVGTGYYDMVIKGFIIY